MQPEIERDFSFGSWAIQFVAAFFGPIILLTGLEMLLGIQGETAISQVVSLLFLGAVAVLMALLTVRISPDATDEGRWIWTLPMILVATAVIWDGSTGHASELSGCLWDPGPGRGEGAFGTLITWPTWSCCCYSSLMQLRRSRTSPRE